MIRKCTNCQKDFTPDELSREESKGMEIERKAMGLEGVLFRFYSCSTCGQACIFVDILSLEGESDDAFGHRRAELEAVINQAEGERIKAVLVPK
jgi:DNA-directed RNA polymerase subunit RPC12/RpoP